MQPHRVFVGCLLAISVALVNAQLARAQSDPYLTDLLKQPAYRAAWNTMLRSGNAPAWLKRGGVEMPATSVGKYLAAETCKPHDCPPNDFHVLFAPDGRQAWGLLLSGGHPDLNGEMEGQNKTWFGNPSDDIKSILETLAGGLLGQ
jgi:hypothetical protein